MKILIFLSLFILNFAYAGTCTTIERTNYSANQILTSTSLNAQLNAIYAPFNNPSGAADGGCIADGTLEDGALNATDFAAMLNGIQRGCKVEYSDANTVTISKCFASVNGNLVAKSSATSLTWGCTDCSSETASTNYYVYIKTGSSGSTINGLISTTAPNADGYDNSGNFVVGRFYNNGSSNIDQYSIDQWVANRFIPNTTNPISYTPSYVGFGTETESSAYFQRFGNMLYVSFHVKTGTTSGTTKSISLPTGLEIDTSYLPRTNAVGNPGTVIGHLGQDGGANRSHKIVTATNTSLSLVYVAGNVASTNIITSSTSLGDTANISGYFMVPIKGWAY